MQFTRWISILLLIVILITTISSKRYRRKKKELKESVCECGISSVHNLEHSGGSSEKYPWVVNLMDKKRNLTTFCVGTVISKSLILTSASCLLESQENNENKECDPTHRFHGFCFKSRSDIAIGFPIIAETFGIFSRGGVTVKKIMPHSHSTENNFEEGLVLLRMYPAFECESIPPVCLGNHKQVIHWTSGIISGWKTDYFKNEGLNMTGQEVQMTTVHSRSCTKIQGHRAVKQAIMCPLKNESASYCKGYAGAPVVVRMKHRFHLIGIMSKNIIDDDCEKHDIYPLICIQNYLSWIHRQIKKEENIHFDGGCFPTCVSLENVPHPKSGYAGAPVVVRMKHRFHLIGIMSKNIIDDDCEKHDIYPLICIQNYLSWIHRQIKKEENIHFDKRFSNRLN